jgi:phosphoribosylanthranilate isomerase
LHGPKPGAAAVRAALASASAKALIIQAIPVPAGAADGSEVRAAVRAAGDGADILLFDTRADGKFGGTGASFPWALAREAAGETPFLVAGGLGPGNAAGALKASGALGVDVSSGVEESPGVKDPDLLRALFAALGSAPSHPSDGRTAPHLTGGGRRPSR